MYCRKVCFICFSPHFETTVNVVKLEIWQATNFSYIHDSVQTIYNFLITKMEDVIKSACFFFRILFFPHIFSQTCNNSSGIILASKNGSMKALQLN